AAKVARMPISALFDLGQGPSVWVVDPITATLSAARVALAGYDADWAFIGAGVPEGAKVVALGVHKLDAGEKVHVVDTLAQLPQFVCVRIFLSDFCACSRRGLMADRRVLRRIVAAKH